MYSFFSVYKETVAGKPNQGTFSHGWMTSKIYLGLRGPVISRIFDELYMLEIFESRVVY